MHISQITIQNFRGIDQQTFTFTDELERIQPVTLIVGPNGAGKSTILDAIWFGLQAVVGFKQLRHAFSDDPRILVQTGKRFAQVRYHIHITEAERQRIQTWKQELIELNDINHSPETPLTDADITWKYPPQPDTQDGGYIYHNDYDWDVLKGGYYARRLHKLNAHSSYDLHLAGGIYLFEQERYIADEAVQSVTSDENTAQDNFRLLRQLTELGVRSQLGKLPEQDNWYKKIQQGYTHVCAPNRMGNVYAPQSDASYDIEFFREDGQDYGFHGLSSGERSVLNFLTQYFSRRMFHSIVLIDELETHLHPLWQRRLLNYLTQLDDGNQFIITTHSPTLRNSVPSTQVIDLGALDRVDKRPTWQLANEGE